MSKIKVALVGTGNMGKNHLRVLRASPDFQLKCVIDPAFDPAICPDLDVPVLQSISDLDSDAIDCAVVATPTETHFSIVKELLQKKLHVLVEKPAASTYGQAQFLVNLAMEKGLHLAVGNIERCNPVVAKLADVLESGVIGTPVHFSATRGGAFPNAVKPGNNVILDLAVHDLDVFRLLLGQLEVKSAMAHQNMLPQIFDTAEITVRSAEGITGSVQANWLSPQKVRQIKVFGTSGVCEIDYIHQTCTLFGKEFCATSLERTGQVQEVEHPFCQQFQCEVARGEPLAIQLGEWTKCLRGEPNRLAKGEQLVESVHLAEKAMELAQKEFQQIEFVGEIWQPHSAPAQQNRLS